MWGISNTLGIKKSYALNKIVDHYDLHKAKIWPWF